MARRLKVIRRHCLHALLAALALSVLTGCASTDELYAEYDELACDVVYERAENNRLVLRETVTDSAITWVPAVYFEYDSSAITDEGLLKLQANAEVLRSYPTLLVGVQGFTDHIGGHAYNLRLSKRRNRSVAEYLMSLGIKRNRIFAQPLGLGMPQIGTDDDKARAVNRRVELVLMDPTGRPVHPRFDSLEP